MAAAVRGMNLDPVKDLLVAPGHDNKFKAVCRIQKMVNSAIARALVQVDGEGDAAQEALYASYSLLYDILCKELGANALEKLRVAMNDEKFRIAFRAVYDITQGIWAEDADDDPQMKAESSKFADSVSYCILYVLAPSVRNALGGQGEFQPFISLSNDVTQDQRKPVCEMIKGIAQAEDVQPSRIEA